jgi:coenzyme F420-reducing hydrogenase alpha subunit
MQKLTLEQWDEMVGRHLRMIEAGAEICESHALQLLGMPDFETRAADSMERAVLTLTMISDALAKLTKAKEHMQEKHHVA